MRLREGARDNRLNEAVTLKILARGLDASCAEYHDALRLLALVLPAAAPDSRTSCVLRARVVVCAVVREPRAALHSPTPAHRTRRRLWQSDHQRGSAACTGGARLVRALLLCRQRTGARQLFGNDELLSLFGFGNVMFDSVGCVQQPRWGRLVRWRLATTFPPVRLLARGPVFSRRLKWLVTVTSRGQLGHADPVSSTCDGRRGSAGSSRL